MTGKRVLQLTLHTLLTVIFIINIPGLFDDGLNLSNFAAAVIVGCVVAPLAGSAKLNWQLVRSQKITIKPPRASSLHFGFIALSIMIIDFSGRMNFSYDSHLSIYALSAELPDWLSLPEEAGNDLGIVATDTGIYMFLFYVFVFALASSMYTWGWFQNNQAHPEAARNTIQPSLPWFQIALGSLFVLLILYSNHRLCIKILNFLAEAREYNNLLNTWNIGHLLSDSLNAILLTLYAIWIFHDGIKLWKATRMRKLHRPSTS